MRINHNIAALNTYRMLGSNTTNASKSLEKLSSGLRINRAGDDAAGLAISEKMRGQIRGLNQASRNSQDAISLIQTAEGALNETHSILQRMRELAVQAASDTNVSVDRDQIQKEINQLTSEINRIGNTTEFNTMQLLNGERAKTAATSENALNAGTFEMSYADGVTGDADMQAAVGSVTVAAGEFLDTITGTAATSIVITKTDSGIQVEMTGGTATGTAPTFSDAITADADGNYTYDDHGVSFTISAADAAALSTGETLTLANVTSADTFAVESTYSFGGTGSITVSDVVVTQDNDNKYVRDMEFQATSATLTVTLKDSAGNTLVQDKVQYSALGSIEYDNHGINFTVDVTNLSTAGTISGSLSLDDELGTTTNVLTYDDNSLKFQVGANENQAMMLDLSDMRADALGISTTTAGGDFVSSKNVSDGTSSTATEYALDVSSHDKAAAAVTIINDAIATVSDERAKLGAVQNRLEHTINNLDTAAENLQASESRIRDVDMAKEMMEFTKNNILLQAGQAMLAQANQQPQGVLQLLR